jgi:hypothetical protein
MSIEAFLNTSPELMKDPNSILIALIKDIVGLNECFCKSSVFCSMRMMTYDQTVGLFIKGDGLYNYFLRGCGDLVSFPRGMILHSKENWSLAACTTINFMIQESYIPLQFIEELSDRQSNSCKQIYKLKRSSGKIQNCILGNNHALFLKGRNTPQSDSKIWKIRVLFNDIDEGVEGAKADDIINLEKNLTTFEKCIDIDEFCKINDIAQLTLNVSKLKEHVTISEHDSDSFPDTNTDLNTDIDSSSEAIYNKQDVIDNDFIENSDRARKYVVDYYISELDKYVQTILPFIQKKINMVLI